MSKDYKIRPVRPEDARETAKLIAISSDGVAMIEWNDPAIRDHRAPVVPHPFIIL